MHLEIYYGIKGSQKAPTKKSRVHEVPKSKVHKVFYEVTKSSPRYFSPYSAITLHEYMAEISGTGEISSSAKKPVI